MIDQSKYKPAELDKVQTRQWRETRTALVFHAPGFTHLFMTMMNPENDKKVAYFTRDVPIAATDGFVMLANPDTFFQYDLMNRVFACGHEILHCVLDHTALLHRWRQAGYVLCADGTKLPFDIKIAQVALDLVVNDMLVSSKIGKLHKDWYHWPHLVTQKHSVTEAYRIIYQASQQGNMPKPPGQPGQPCPDGPNGPDQGQNQGESDKPDKVTVNGNSPEGSFDQHLKPGEAQGKNPTTAIAERSETKWARELAAAMELDTQAGKGAGGSALLFKELLTPKVDWTDKLRAVMARKIGSDRWEWRVPDRRLITRDIYAPSRSGHGTGTIVIGGDTSGSVINERDMFLAEVSGVLTDMKPRKVIIVWCDYHVHDVDVCESPDDLNTIRRRGVRGGGGTSFVPVFDWIRDNQVEPDCLIYLTDGDGRFPGYTPNYPVIWGSTVKKPNQYPWGEVVMVPKQKPKGARY